MTKFPIFEVTAGKQAGATTGQVHRRAAPGPSTGTIRAHVVPFLGGLPAIGHSLRSLACGTRLQRWQAPGRSRHCTSRLSAVQARRPAAASRRQKKTRTAEVNTVISPLLPLGRMVAVLVDFDHPGFRAVRIGPPSVTPHRLSLPMHGNDAYQRCHGGSPLGVVPSPGADGHSAGRWASPECGLGCGDGQSVCSQRARPWCALLSGRRGGSRSFPRPARG
jgi:hypothetical protein